MFCVARSRPAAPPVRSRAYTGAIVKRFLLERGGLITLCVVALYLWLAPAHVVDGDNAEFSTMGAVGGLAHPSGYPSYVLWLRAFAWLPASTPAHAAAIATVILAGVQMLVMHAACRAWGARATSASLAVAVFAASPFVMRIYTEAEVYAGNGLVVALVLWLSAAAGPLRGERRALALGLVAGLGLGNHLTCVLVAPVGLLGAQRAVRESGARTVPLALLGLALGLATYVYAFIAPDNPLSWQRPTDLGGLVALFTREAYGGVGGFTGAGAHVPVVEHLQALGASLAHTWAWVLLPVGLVTLGWACARPGQGEPRAGWIVLAVAWVVAGPLLATRFDLPAEGVGLYIVRRFHVLPSLLLVIPVAVGLDRAWASLTARGLVQRVPGPGFQSAAAVIALVGLAAPSLSHVGAVHSPAMERGAANLLGALPADAIVIGRGDDVHTAVNYLQLARGVRRDVTYVHWRAMSTPWYRARVATRGVAFVPTPGEPPLMTVVRLGLATSRPVFVEPQLEVGLGALPRSPHGVLLHVLPAGTPLPSLDDVLALERQQFAAFDLDYERPGRADEFAAAAHLRYAAVWTRLAQALARAGRASEAARAAEIAAQLAPE